MKREGELSATLATILRQQNAVVIPQVAGKLTHVGCADKYICHRYWRGWLEFKVLGGHVWTPAQQDFCRLVVERGDNYALVTFPNRDALREYTQIHVAQYWPLCGPGFEYKCQVNQLLRYLGHIAEHIAERHNDFMPFRA